MADSAKETEFQIAVRTEPGYTSIEKQLNHFVDALPFGVEVYDVSGNLLKTNSSWNSIWQIDAPAENFNIIESRKKFSVSFQKIIMHSFKGDSGNTKAFFMRHPAAAGINRRVNYQYYPLKNEDGEIQFVIFLCQDSTENGQTPYVIEQSIMKYKNLFNTLPIGLYMYNLNDEGKLIFSGTNLAADRMVGIDHSKFIGKEITDVFPALAETEIPKKYEEVARNGSSFTIDNFYYSFGDIKGYFNVFAFQDAPGRMVVAFLNVSKWVQSENELRESKDKYISIIENSHAGVIVLDDNFKIEFVNDRICDMFQYSKEELLQNDFRKFLFSSDAEILQERYSLRLSGIINSRNYEYALTRKDGTKLIVETNTSIYNDSTGHKKILSQLLDVTNKKIAEDALRISEERFRSIFENANIGIYRSTPEGKLLMANPALLKLYGYNSIEELSSKNIEDFGSIKKENRQKFLEVIEHEGKIKGFETCWKKSNGEVIFIRENAVAIRDENGKTIYYEGTAEDITESKRSHLIEETLFAISEAATKTSNLVEYLTIVQVKLKVLIDTTNFFVALYNPATKLYSFPFHRDVIDPDEIFGDHELKGSLTDYVRRTAQPILITREVEDNLIRAGEVDGIIGTPSPIWLGAPLKVDEEVIGVVAIQSYESSTFYTKHDLDLLNVIAQHISSAVRKKQTDDKLINSENKYKNFISQSSEGIWRIKFDNPISINDDVHQQTLALYNGLIAECNVAFAHMYGYDSPDDVIGKRLQELYGEFDEENFAANFEFIRKGYKIVNVETIEMNASGQLVYYLNNAVGIIKDEKLVSLWGTQRDITELKTTEYALKESERKFKEMAELMPQVIFETDRDGTLHYSNQKGFDLLDITDEELKRGINISDLFLEDEIDKVKKDFSLSLLFVNDRGREYVARSLKGKEFPVLIFSSPIYQNGSTIGIRGVLVDITERKKIESKIKESEEKFRSLIENMNEVVYMTDQNGVFTYVSPAVTKVVGYEPHELISHKFTDFIVPEDVKTVSERFGQMIHEQLPPIEYRIYAKDKSIRWITSSSKPIFQDGKFIGMNGLVTDIHVTKTALESLKEKEDRLRLISEAAFEGIVFTERGVIKDANEQAAQIFGMNREEFLNKNLIDFIDPQSKTRDKLINQIEKPERGVLEYKAFKKDSSVIYVETRGRDFKHHNSNVRVTVIRDITDRKKFEKEILKSKEVAEKSDKLKSEFLAQMSHEIRTPVNTVLSFAGLLNDELYDQINEELRGTFQIMQHAGKRIIRTIDLILNMSQIQTNTYDFNAVKFDLNEKIIKPILKEYEKSIRDKNLELKFITSGEEQFIVADEYTVGQIFHNLIDNAIKYTQSGFVEISVVKSNENKLVASVLDSGIGISSEYLPNIFKLFSQEEQGYTRRFEGNGLGMALVKKYCDLNNADITVLSEKGKGTKFTVTFN